MSTRLEILLAERERRRAARAQAGAAPQAAPQSNTRLEVLLAERERRRAAREQQAAQQPVQAQRAMSALTYAGIEQARSAVGGGQASLGDLVENTKAELVSKYGAQGVRPVYARGGRFVDFEIKGPQGAWVTSGAKEYLANIIKEQQASFEKTVDTEQGAGIGARLEAGVKLTPEGRYGNLVARYGEENVVPKVGDDGQIVNFYIREAPTAQFRIFDPEGKQVSDLPGDIADIGADVLSGIPGAVAGVAARRFGPGAAQVASMGGDFVGDLARQGVSEMLPGEDRMTAKERLGSATAAVGGGIAGEAGLRVAAGAVKLPWSAARKMQEKLIRSQRMPQTAEQAQALADTTLTGAAKREAIKDIPTTPQVAERNKDLFAGSGVEPTAGQLSGNRDLVSFENFLRQSPGSRDLWAAKDLLRMRALGKHVDTLLQMTGEDAGGDALTRQIADAGEMYIGGMYEQANKEFAAIAKRVDKMSGNQRIVPAAKLVKTLQRIINTGSSGLASKGIGRDEVAAAKGILDGIVAASGGNIKDVRYTMRELQRDLHEFGLAARGKKTLAENIDAAASTRVARELFGAIKEDLDAAASRVKGYDEGPVPLRDRGDLPSMLKGARDRYRGWMEQIEQAKDALIQKSTGLANVKDQPHKLVPQLLGSDMSDEQVSASMARLSAIPGGKDLAQSLRREVMASLLDRSAPQGATQLGGEYARALARGEDVSDFMSPAKFANAFSANRKRIEALFAGDKETLAAWRKAYAIAATIGDTGGMAGSQTGPFGMFRDAAKAFGRGDVMESVSMLNQLLNNRRFSVMLNDPVQRDIFFGLARPPRDMTPQQWKRMAGKLMSMWARDNKLAGASEPGDEVGESEYVTASNEANR